jgi:hypothetical protein
LKQRIQSTKRLGEILDSVTGDLHSKDLSRLRRLELAWSDLLPETLSQCVRPIRITQQHLEVEIDTPFSSAVKRYVMETLPTTLKQSGIASVSYRAANRSVRQDQPKSTVISSKAEVQTAAITDPGLRAAMAQLLSAVDKHQG